MFENREQHPAYGMLAFHRVSSGDPNLFGSSVKHNHNSKKQQTYRLFLTKRKGKQYASNLSMKKEHLQYNNTPNNTNKGADNYG